MFLSHSREISILFLFLLFSARSSAQNRCTCDDKAKASYNGILPQKKSDYMELLKKEKNQYCYLYGLNSLYDVLNNAGEFDEGLKLAAESRTLFTEHCQDTLLAENYFWTAGFYTSIGNSDSALAYYIRSVDLAEKIKSYDVLIRATADISIIFTNLGQTRKSLLYLTRAKNLAIKVNDNNKTAIIYGNIASDYGQLYSDTGEEIYLDSALQSQDQSIQFARRINNSRVIQFGYGTMAAIHIIKKNYTVALKYCDSLMVMKDLLDQNRAIFYTRKADIYKAMGMSDLALLYADSSYHLALIASPPQEIMSTMNGLIEAYKLVGNTPKAMELTQKLMAFKDSVTNVETMAKVSELEQKYNKTQNEKRISELNKENEIALLNIKFMTAGILAALLVIVMIVFFYRQSVLRNKFKVLEAEQRLNRARINPHFFFNVLYSIQALAGDKENNSKVVLLISKFSKIMRQSLESTYDDLTTIETEIEFLTNYLDIQKVRFPNKFEYKIIVGENVESNELLIPGMLLQPFIENSIEHGFKNIDYKGELVIAFAKQSDILMVSLKDNGRGFDKTNKVKEQPSRAIQIINDRIALLNRSHKAQANVGLHNNGQAGVSVNLDLPCIYKN